MTHYGSRAAKFAVMHNTGPTRCGRVPSGAWEATHETTEISSPRCSGSAAAATWPLAARTQQGEPSAAGRDAAAIPRKVGMQKDEGRRRGISRGTPGFWVGRRAAMVNLDIRCASGASDKARSFAKERIGMTPDVIVPSSNLVTTFVQQETRTILSRIHPGRRSDRQRLCREHGHSPAATSPVSLLFGGCNRRKMGGNIERDRASGVPPRRGSSCIPEHALANIGLLRAAEAGTPSGIKLVALRRGNKTPPKDRKRRHRFLRANADGGLNHQAPHAVTFAIATSSSDWRHAIAFPPCMRFAPSATSGGLVSYGTNPIAVWREGYGIICRSRSQGRPSPPTLPGPGFRQNMNWSSILGLPRCWVLPCSPLDARTRRRRDRIEAGLR